MAYALALAMILAFDEVLAAAVAVVCFGSGLILCEAAIMIALGLALYFDEQALQALQRAGC